MDKYTVKVLPAGHMLVFRGKRARTPVTFKGVLKSEIPLLDAQARRSLLHIEVSKEGEVKPETVIEDLDIIKEDEDIEVEELTEKAEPSTILEKLLVSDSEE